MKKQKELFSRYDTADYPESEADIAAYLTECADTSNRDTHYLPSGAMLRHGYDKGIPPQPQEVAIQDG